MSELWGLVLAGIGGCALGVIFFGGLWWTVRKGLTSSKPAVWVFTSLLLRMGITLAGFYFAGAGDWRRLLVCMAGFLMARQIVMRLSRLPDEDPSRLAQEVRHAP